MRSYSQLLKKGAALFAVSLALLGTGVGDVHAADTRDQGNAQQVLSKEVRHQLLQLPWYGVFDNLEYSVNGSEVTLSGQVVQPVTKYNAGLAVMGIQGITHVTNNITVLPLSKFDDQIRRAEYRAIFTDGSLGRYAAGPVPAIHIIVNNGHVTLDGVVNNAMAHNIATIRASSVPGVFSVTNNLQIG